MKLSGRNLYQRVQSSGDSEEQLPHPSLNNETTHSQRKQSHPHDNTSSEDDEPRIQDALKAPTSHRSAPKKTVVIEIKGKTPPRGEVGMYALKYDERRLVVPNNNHPNDDTPPVVLSKERLVDTRKLQKSGGCISTTLDRVKRLQDRAGVVDIQERIPERRDRCFNQGRSYGKSAFQRFRGAGGGSASVSSSLYHDAVAEKPMLRMDAKHDGVLKVSDRSFCENGEIMSSSSD